MASIHQVVPIYNGIRCHAWNADQSMLAICPNNNEIHIYGNCNSKDTSSWKLLHVLSEHDMEINQVDWCPSSHRLLTCSSDRNAFVWTPPSAGGSGGDSWKPALAMLHTDRAALCCRWSPCGKKFAVGSSARAVNVGYHEAEHDWWVTKLLRKHRSSVVGVDWCPGTNSQVLATASTDFRARICSVHMEGVDQGPPHPPPGFTNPLPFGEIYAEFSCSTWVTAVSWSPSGLHLAYSGQDSTVHVVGLGPSVTGGAALQCVVRLKGLPLRTL
eukprot:CAMPEP_0113941534 /NCGR_PEP_ID=MMETSP1339-20121228/7432_1 /TAXON_ID=94617 /ORGANISM="Fibrocapsa japonica" /LENGTH=270 /DNA_ID=CAMNT_0000945709 /DNA_START=17 /DNA_END=826 /DNA_ORIENTATION=- /assembly_acc=CAM_ASM_000762